MPHWEAVPGMPAQPPQLLLPSSDFPSGSGGWGRALFAEHNCIDSEFGRSVIARARLEHFRFGLLLFSVMFLRASGRRGRPEARKSANHGSIARAVLSRVEFFVAEGLRPGCLAELFALLGG